MNISAKFQVFISNSCKGTAISIRVVCAIFVSFFPNNCQVLKIVVLGVDYNHNGLA